MRRPERRTTDARGGAVGRSDALDAALRTELAPERGRLAVAARTWPDGDTVLHDAEACYPVASVVKWPLRLAWDVAAADGEVDPDRTVTVGPDDLPGGTGVLQRLALPREVRLADAADLMVIVSDNLACNLVMDALGGREDADRRIGALVGDGVRLRSRALFDPGREVPSMGEASAAGLLAFLTGLVEVRWGAASSASHDVARRTLDRSMLPRYLPDPVLAGGGPDVAHKSGTMPGVRADAGVLHGAGRTLALVVLTEGVDDGGFGYENEAERRIGRIAALLAARHLGASLAPEVAQEGNADGA